MVSEYICGLILAEFVSRFEKINISQKLAKSGDRAVSKAGCTQFASQVPVFETLHVIIRKGIS